MGKSVWWSWLAIAGALIGLGMMPCRAVGQT